MKRSAAFLFAILIFFCTLPACGKQESPKTCREILSAVTQAEIGIPAGKFYSLSADEGDPEFLSESLISSLFGGGSYPEVAADWLDCALFLSLGSHPCEFAVILCNNHDTAEDTARLLGSRLSAIKITKTSPQYQKMIETAKVAVIGNYALLIISSDSENAMKTAKKIMK